MIGKSPSAICALSTVDADRYTLTSDISGKHILTEKPALLHANVIALREKKKNMYIDNEKNVIAIETLVLRE